MATTGTHVILQDSVLKAEKYKTEKNYGRSFAHYLVVFQLLKPEHRHIYLKDFTDVLHIWGSILHKQKQYINLFKCYDLALKYFPNNAEILDDVGIHALKLRNYTSAKTYFENALINNPNYLPAEQNLKTTKYEMIDRWHFPMLNDLNRNKAFAQAIFVAISQGFTNILDIGTGTGLLSLFASKSKQIKSIVACDHSEIMCEIAKDVLIANNANNIQLINKDSTELCIPNDLKKRVSLVVTEILDSGVFGERILEALIHAWENLLLPAPYGKVIPYGVAIYITGIQSEELSKIVRVQNNNLLKINELCLYYSTEPYDTENLKIVNLNYVTETQLALYVDFNNIHQLKLINDYKNNPDVLLKCLKTGHIDAFVMWFTLYLNETTTLTNNPNTNEKSCWDQAIFHVDHPFNVQSNQEILLKLSCTNHFIEIECSEDRTHNKKCFSLQRDAVAFLNDSEFMQQIYETFQYLLNKYENCVNKLKVLDLSPLPVLGLLLAQKGAKLSYRFSDVNVELAVKSICKRNCINQNLIESIEKSQFDDDTNSNKQYDIIFQNLLTSCGLINEEEIFQLDFLKFSLTNHGIYLPNRIFVYAQLVHCEWLEQVTKVDDKNVCGFRIAEFINEYKSTEQRDIKINQISHVPLTEATNLGLVTNNVTDVNILKTQVSIINKGTANAIFYWYNLEIVKEKYVNTRNNQSFVNNGAFILETPITVNCKDEICLVLKQHKGILKIFLE